MGEFCMMIDKEQKLGSWAITAQTEVKGRSLHHHTIVDADDNSSGQFVGGHDLGTVGSLPSAYEVC